MYNSHHMLELNSGVKLPNCMYLHVFLCICMYLYVFIDSLKLYESNTEIHNASAIYSKAFCVLSKKPTWGIQDAFQVRRLQV